VDEQRRAEAVLRESDRRKDEFIAVLAHELRNPLAPIRNAVQVLKMRGNGDMQLTWARGIIERQAAQMAHLLDDLLDVSRISQNKLELEKTRVTLDSVLECALEVSRPQMEQHRHQLEMNVLSAGPVYVDADAYRLAQAFSNLLNNAAKYTEPGGRISLTVRVEEPDVVVSVKDTGIGIAPDVLPRVFAMFSQASPASDRSQGGLGIGLALVHSIITMHAGTVEARSEGIGKGSEFMVRIPTAAKRFTPAPPHRVSTAVAGLKILVADDNRDAAETLSVLLELLGHDVVVAADGEEAIRRAEDFKPEVALLDIGMPKLNGYEAAEELRRRHPRLLLIATTGWGQLDDLRRAAAAGFDHHLTKPIDLDQLTQLIVRAEPEEA